MANSLDFRLGEEEEERLQGGTEGGRKRWQAAALARVLRTLDGFHAINLQPLHLRRSP